MPSINKVKLGASGPEVFPIALGCMGMSGMYGPTDEDESVATIQAAVERGVDLIDTGDFYGMGHNEALLRRALVGRRDRVKLSVKFGALRGPDGSWLGVDNRPAAVQNACAYSLNRLGVERIDVYRPARLDPAVPIEDTVGAIGVLIKKGYVGHVALSEVGAETTQRAAAVSPIVDVQLEYSLVSRGPEAKVFPALQALGVGATLYGVFSRGLLTGRVAQGPTDFRTWLPRFSKQNAAQNASVVAAFKSFAADRGSSPAQLALAWVLAKQPRFVPVIGVKTRAQLEDALGALERPLAADEVDALEALVAPTALAGTRYPGPQMAHLDSER